MGKRDFVDRVDSVDPVGQSHSRIHPEPEESENISEPEPSSVTDLLSPLPPIDGVVLIDPEALAGRKGR